MTPAGLLISLGYNCELNCKYCWLKNKYPGIFWYEELKEVVTEFKERHKGQPMQLGFTGGEPFLYWNQISYILDEFGDDFSYIFYTSGNNLDAHKIQVLSKYRCDFVLSVDGGKRLTQFLRPLNHNEKSTYWNNFSRIAPTLLYYFPQTAAKVIINHRFVSKVYENALELEQLGFKHIRFVLDYKEHSHEDVRHDWTEKEQATLLSQIMKLTDRIAGQYMSNIQPMTITNIDDFLRAKLVGTEPIPENLLCGLFDGKETVMRKDFSDGKKVIGSCHKAIGFPDLEEVKEILREEYRCTKKCPKNSECGFWDWCRVSMCPMANFEFSGGWMDVESNVCLLNRVMGICALRLLENCNQMTEPTFEYSRYIRLLKGSD